MAYDFTITSDGPAVSDFRDEQGRVIQRRIMLGKRVMVDMAHRRGRARLSWKETQYHRIWRYTHIDLRPDASHQEIASEVIAYIGRRMKSNEQVTRARQRKAKANAPRRRPKAVDFQRQRLYDAENTLPERHEILGAGTLDETAAFMEHVIDSDYWKSQPHHLMDIRITGGRHHAGCRREEHKARIAMPPSLRTPLVCLHELAHVLAPTGAKIAGHGPEFARAYIGLVEQFMDDDVARRLRVAFRRGNVDF